MDEYSMATDLRKKARNDETAGRATFQAAGGPRFGTAARAGVRGAAGCAKVTASNAAGAMTAGAAATTGPATTDAERHARQCSSTTQPSSVWKKDWSARFVPKPRSASRATAAKRTLRDSGICLGRRAAAG